ncbi:type II toxin-antitoxin system RelE/ParE family toxin [Methylomonas sp. HYX-M1]|uniref:type II toxin-antitoxin system RelE/ParE family toxin n=1 Tax=Methylomonas sp. HYX-M1 TaxID=3139307 RepID=UPI00345C1DCE
MIAKELLFLEEVAADLQTGKRFYDASQPGVGGYFFDSLIADIESLHLYAGIHEKQFGLFRMLAKRFPYAIYYDVTDSAIIVVAVLDLRRNPIRIASRLNSPTS